MIYVARHGETEWNREGRYQGRCESQLTSTGLAQAHALAQALAEKPIARVISSPLSRCMETARLLAQRLDVSLENDMRLLEIAHGDWEGRLRTEIERDDPQTLRAWQQTPERVHFRGGESLEDVLARWRAFLADLSGHDEIAVFTHDVIVRLAILNATGRTAERLWEPRVVNAGYAIFNQAGGAWSLRSSCEDAHLGELLLEPVSQAL
jgi:broad specificity phosphatase PhoE